MKLIDTITIRYQDNERSVMLFVGDLTRMPEHEAVDMLIVSAFPDDYVPIPPMSDRPKTGSFALAVFHRYYLCFSIKH